MNYHVVEKDNPLALHGVCYSQESAERWIERYGDSRMFNNKTLTKESFKVVTK